MTSYVSPEVAARLRGRFLGLINGPIPIVPHVRQDPSPTTITVSFRPDRLTIDDPIFDPAAVKLARRALRDVVAGRPNSIVVSRRVLFKLARSRMRKRAFRRWRARFRANVRLHEAQEKAALRVVVARAERRLRESYDHALAHGITGL